MNFLENGGRGAHDDVLFTHGLHGHDAGAAILRVKQDCCQVRCVCRDDDKDKPPESCIFFFIPDQLDSGLHVFGSINEGANGRSTRPKSPCDTTAIQNLAGVSCAGSDTHLPPSCFPFASSRNPHSGVPKAARRDGTDDGLLTGPPDTQPRMCRYRALVYRPINVGLS